MRRIIIYTVTGLFLSPFCLFAQKRYSDTKTLEIRTPIAWKGVILPGKMSYGFYKDSSGNTIMDGAFKFSGSTSGWQGKQGYSSSLNVSGGYKNGVLNGTFSAKGHDETSRWGNRMWTADYGAEIMFVKGNIEGKLSVWLNDSEESSKLFATATVKNGKLIGSYHCNSGTYSWETNSHDSEVSGQFTSDGTLTGEWRYKNSNGRIDIYNFKNNVLVSGGRGTWNDELYRLSKEYASKKISKEGLMEMGYGVNTAKLNLGCLSFLVTRDFSYGLNQFCDVNNLNFNFCERKYEFIEQVSLINEKGLSKLYEDLTEHIKSHRPSKDVCGSDSIAEPLPFTDKYLKLNVYSEYLRDEYFDGGYPSMDKAIISRKDYESLLEFIDSTSRSYPIRYYDLLEKSMSVYAETGNYKSMVSMFGAKESIIKIKEAIETIEQTFSGNNMTDDGKFYIIPDSYLLVEKPSEVKLDYLEKALVAETEYETLCGKVKENISEKRSDKSLRQNAFKSMAKIFHDKVDARLKPELNTSMRNALKVLDNGKVFEAIDSENRRIKSECSSKLAASVSACTKSLLGDGSFSDVKSCNAYMARINEAVELQKDAVEFFTIKNEAQEAKAGVMEKYGKVYKNETKAFASKVDTSLPEVNFTSHDEILEKIEICNDLIVCSTDFANTCSVADTMNTEYDTLVKTVKANKKAAKQLGIDLKSPDLKPIFSTVEDMQKKTESYRTLVSKIVAAGV